MARRISEPPKETGEEIGEPEHGKRGEVPSGYHCFPHIAIDMGFLLQINMSWLCSQPEAEVKANVLFRALPQRSCRSPKPLWGRCANVESFRMLQTFGAPVSPSSP